ncbi:hypothetical protein [Wolbachia endosymbiont of Tribolium confusum]|uniref:hypothetical protein n=1 Tax=Wolbachia endosymbiont of Tribolium confusum TaxID=214474 RepID=UPI001CF2F6EA|nr:hypothetical protein [Wolbachia endosymbiont of Tribolium confusum]MCA7010908.1 hypothetical protein [Wolbachia endosymbiont of Tribolium confusum]
MNDPFKSEDYKKNLDSLIKAIKLGNSEKQYDKTVTDLSHALEGFTDKAEDVAKLVIRDDLNNCVKKANKKPLILRIFNRILGRDVSIRNISNFIKDKLPLSTARTAIEYTDVIQKISDLERIERSQDKYRSYGVNLENRQQKKNLLYEREDSGYGGSLNEDSEYEEISNYQEEKSKSLTKDLRNLQSIKEEPIYATIPKEHIEAKREHRKKQQLQSLAPPKPSRVPPVPEKMFTINKKIRQEPKKDKPAVPPKPKDLGEKVSTEQKIVVEKSAESNPTLPLKSENQDGKESAKKADGPKVLVVAMKKEVTRESSKVKALKERFERNQVKNVLPAENKTASVTQTDISVKRKQSRSFPVENKKSSINHLASKNLPSTNVSVKEMVKKFEGRKGER